MISKELKNDFCEMIFGTFCAGFEDVIYSWEKNHFLRKWAFPEMDGNHFFPENARQPPKILSLSYINRPILDKIQICKRQITKQPNSSKTHENDQKKFFLELVKAFFFKESDLCQKRHF